MNPIFSRRYKGGGRPNIMATGKRQNYVKSLSASSPTSSPAGGGILGLSADDVSASGVEPLQRVDDRVKSPSSEEIDSKVIFKKKAPQQQQHNGGGSGLAHQLLTSKQNMLANLSLTPHENRQRTKIGGHQQQRGIRHSSSTEFPTKVSQKGGVESSGTNVAPKRSPTVHEIGKVPERGCGQRDEMIFCELEDMEDDTGPPPRAPEPSAVRDFEFSMNSRISRPNLNQRISKEPLNLRVWRELKQIVCGNSGFHDGWIGQGFTFDRNIPFGLVQRKGGPCGVLAVVQSLLIRNLLFGSPLAAIRSKQGKQCGEAFKKWLSGDDPKGEWVARERESCLIDAVTEILWNCRQSCRSKSQLHSEFSVIFSEEQIQPQVIHLKGQLDLEQFLEQNLHRFDCISLVYSAVLTRGIAGVKEDMDFENSLVGQHGYCSQELINLLVLGQAISNTFDDEIELDGKVLKGITSECPVGLLSLFEHYDSIMVGSRLKCPRYPLWIVCSESHFSVLFSSDDSLCGDNNNSSCPPRFDLCYYDGLARQEDVIRLSIDLPDKAVQPSGLSMESRVQHGSSSSSSRSTSQKSSSWSSGEDLIPPLEKCIRTKWAGAAVDWNGSEPLL